ncbi:YceI family protein [Zobellia uliginosa]|uniref:YceI family protein n=1 Tax=Zobellia uliginosa TaxID=143224 RepID=UPI0026E32299|nr:YceI family protein [Zobellia uliginosa]MDO6515589.1 YceI family protein [Zobellia uliginosa]
MFTMKNTFLVWLLVAFTFVGRAQDEYVLSDQSKLTISGTSTVHDWTVAANALSGRLGYDGTAPTQIDFEVAVENIQSERGAAMDKKMHAALKKEEHPTITFKLKEVKDKSIFVGVLRIAGVEKSVDIPVDMESDSQGLKITGKKQLTLQDYGMEPPTAMFGQIIVGDEVTVNFDLRFSKN